MVNPAVATAYIGAAAQSAMALNLPKHVIEGGNKALEMLTSTAPDFGLPTRSLAFSDASHGQQPTPGNLPKGQGHSTQIG